MNTSVDCTTEQPASKTKALFSGVFRVLWAVLGTVDNIIWRVAGGLAGDRLLRPRTGSRSTADGRGLTFALLLGCLFLLLAQCGAPVVSPSSASSSAWDARGDKAQVAGGGRVLIPVLDNDTYQGDPTVEVVAAPATVWVSVSDAGLLVDVSNYRGRGDFTIRYALTGEFGRSVLSDPVAARVQVHVNASERRGSPTVPTAQDDKAVVASEGRVFVPVLDNDFYLGVASIEVVDSPPAVWVTVSDEGLLVDVSDYKGPADFNITYSLSDESGDGGFYSSPLFGRVAVQVNGSAR